MMTSEEMFEVSSNAEDDRSDLNETLQGPNSGSDGHSCKSFQSVLAHVL